MRRRASGPLQVNRRADSPIAITTTNYLFYEN